ncbi:interactor of HORMAD1 protein 1 isoform X2 [Mixophyes fleayi]
MNFNVWNIKDMFSVPPGAGTSKSSSRNAGANDHSSLTDSQFLFSSQFCPDSSQSGSTDYNAQAKYKKNANQSSQDSNPSVYQKYQAKPPLFSSDCKERGTFQPFGSGKAKSMMEQFEESKKKAKEKHDSEQVNQLICNIQVTLHDLKMTFCHIEESRDVRCKSIMDSIDAVSKELQENILSYRESIIKAVSTKSDMEQALLDLEKKILLRDAEMTDLKSNVQLLLSAMDVIKLQQSEKHLELSEKMTWLSDSMKSSEDKILSEIHKINLVSELALNLKDKTTQTSPVQDLSVQRHITSQINTMRTCPYGSPLSQTNIQSTSDGISNTLAVQQKENLCATDLKGLKICNVASVGNVRYYSNAAESSDVLQKNYKESDANNQTKSFKNNITLDDIGVNSVHSLQPLYQNDHCIPIEQDNFQNTDPYYRKENISIVNRGKKNTKNPKRGKTNKPRKNVKKKRTGPSLKNTTPFISSANNAQYKSVNESVTHKWANSDKETQNCFTLYPESCEPSLSVYPAPMRKTQQKKSLKFQLNRSHQTIKQSTEKETSAGDRASLSKTEPTLVHDDLPSWDSNDLYCSKDCENNMLWFPSSSPLLNNSSTHPVQKKGQKNFHSFFFDSSDDSD